MHCLGDPGLLTAKKWFTTQCQQSAAGPRPTGPPPQKKNRQEKKKKQVSVQSKVCSWLRFTDSAVRLVYEAGNS